MRVFLLLLAVVSVVFQTTQQTSTEEQILNVEREQREAYLRHDVKATERLIADEFVQTVWDGTGGKATLLNFLRTEPADPTLTLTAEDVRVRINGDTAIVTGKRVERRRSPDNNQQGVAYARYTRTYIKHKRSSGWQLLSEHLQPIPAERTAIKVDADVFSDFIGKYDTPIFTFTVKREGDRLLVVPDDKRRPIANHSRFDGYNESALEVCGGRILISKVHPT